MTNLALWIFPWMVRSAWAKENRICTDRRGHLPGRAVSQMQLWSSSPPSLLEGVHRDHLSKLGLLAMLHPPERETRMPLALLASLLDRWASALEEDRGGESGWSFHSLELPTLQA